MTDERHDNLDEVKSGGVEGDSASETTQPGKTLLDDVATESPEDVVVREMLEHSIDLHRFTPAVEALDPADAADALEELESEDAAGVVFEMEDASAAQNLAEMQAPLASTVLEDLADEHGAGESAKYIELMDLDDAVDVLQEMPEELRDAVLSHVRMERANRLRMLLAFDPESAGGMMRPDCVVVNAEGTKEDAIEQMRGAEWWSFNRIFAVDGEGKLVGEVAIRDLLIAEPGAKISEMMGRDIDVLRPDLDREEIADAFERYEYTVMPVVNRADHLLGVVTVDDVMETIHDEATEDTYRMVGAGKSEAVYSGLGEKFKGRIPWLLVNLFTSVVAASVVFHFSGLFAKLTILAVLMPMIANQAGNAGQQSLAVTLRGLVLGEVRTSRVWPLIWRETLLGILTGAMVGATVGILIGGLSFTEEFGGQGLSWHLGMVVMLAMTGSLGVGCLAGTLVPLVMARLKRDPATASTIFLTMVTDTVSFLTFLGLAWVMLGLTAGG